VHHGIGKKLLDDEQQLEGVFALEAGGRAGVLYEFPDLLHGVHAGRETALR
jgi:hypothetical protein